MEQELSRLDARFKPSRRKILESVEGGADEGRRPTAPVMTQEHAKRRDETPTKDAATADDVV